MSFEERFARLAGARDGAGLYRLLGAAEEAGGAKRARYGERGAAAGSDATAAALLDARRAGATAEGLRGLCAALQSWCARFLTEPGDAAWMLAPLLRLAAAPRAAAGVLDTAAGGEEHRKSVVEVMREQFQRLHRDRERRAGALAVCCELLRLYFSLGQASQCTFLLAAVGQRTDLSSLPKALAVSLAFLWGKHCVLAGNVAEAEERLGWAFANCPPTAAHNRRRILAYLVPCRLRFGRALPAAALRRYGLGSYAGVASAVAAGDVRLFNEELEKHEAEFIATGTYLVVEKLKLLAYQNLCRRLHAALSAEIVAAGKAEHKHKQDLTPYERALEWQDGCDPDEATCILATLIYIGAIRGYLSDEHHKIVFSKESPFPAAGAWSPKA